ncbi:hypothetical protein ASU33_16540 [Solirubrum puertoriconensis]|uniref:DUF2268 domain-containing protein n=2 Tax=Solirubrum puertoriconensis TaxID=1751427 RepID=A0A9X0HNJ1_SOLP1|nr:hypothetical protein ASU33_16540 [Solirubrum puertoriconensis]
MPAFEEFWQKAQTQDEATQVKLFQQLLAERYPEVYNNNVLGGPTDKTFAEVLPLRYAKVHNMVLPKMDLVLRLSRQIGRDLPRYETTFRKTFPDLDYRGRIYFMYSLGGFDGGTRTIEGKQALLFGLDMIAYVYGQDADPAPFFHHEFFHIYHSQFFDGNESVVSALWREGLATYVAKALNPKAEGVNLFGLPLNTPARTQAELPRYARELRAVLDSEKREDYARYFLGGMDEQAATPARSGYYLGYLVAEKLAKRHSLQELAHAKLAQLRPEIEQALTELESGAVSK